MMGNKKRQPPNPLLLTREEHTNHVSGLNMFSGLKIPKKHSTFMLQPNNQFLSCFNYNFSVMRFCLFVFFQPMEELEN